MKSVIFYHVFCVMPLKQLHFCLKDLKKCNYFFFFACVRTWPKRTPLPPRTQTYAFSRPPSPLLRAYVLCEWPPFTDSDTILIMYFFAMYCGIRQRRWSVNNWMKTLSWSVYTGYTFWRFSFIFWVVIMILKAHNHIFWPIF